MRTGPCEDRRHDPSWRASRRTPAGAQFSVSAWRIGEISTLGAVIRAGRPRTRGNRRTRRYGTAHHVAVDVDVDITATTRRDATTAAAAPLGHSFGRQPHADEDNCSNGSNGSI